LIIVNYKAYRKAIGKNSQKITEKIENGAKESQVIVCPQTADLNRVETGLEVFAQHTDGVDTGSETGSNQVKAIKESGVSGSLINHSERRLEDEEIRDAISKCREEELTSVVCAQTPEECEKYARFEPDYIAFEPPELIGSDRAVSKTEPELIKKAIEKTGNVETLTGAGIKTKEDVEKSMELGCSGVLIASGVIKSDNVKATVKTLCEGL
jgi:triosephosphate isomerase